MAIEVTMKQSMTNNLIADSRRTFMISELPPPTIFTGTMAAWVDKADGTLNQHVSDIQDTRKRFDVQMQAYSTQH